MLTQQIASVLTTIVDWENNRLEVLTRQVNRIVEAIMEENVEDPIVRQIANLAPLSKVNDIPDLQYGGVHILGRDQ